MSQHDSLILNSPTEYPTKHWKFIPDGHRYEIVDGRREAGYTIADPKAKRHHDRGVFIPLLLVNQIRKRVDAWRAADYPGVTGVTKKLLAHWHNHTARDYPLFFCQLEAIETLIWCIEAPAAERAGIAIPSDGGAFQRLCCKLATGTGKTVVMAMLIAWQVCNRATYPRDARFSRYIFIVAPNLTVRERLAVLMPSAAHNYYDEFHIVPLALREQLRQGKILIRNWHALNWESADKLARKKSVDKRGPKSDAAYAYEVLGELSAANNFIVINDEAHHAWRVPSTVKIKGVAKDELYMDDVYTSTKWIAGLDRLHRARGILHCFDFSATPFAPTGHRLAEESLFEWVVSDFGLTDAIEAGLVKTPRVVVRDDALPNAQTYKSRLYHIYNDADVKDDLNRRAKAHEDLPDLIINAYAILGGDWKHTRALWLKSGAADTPPVMITVANRVETAARVAYAFKENRIPNAGELSAADGMLHIDSKILKDAEKEDAFAGKNSGAKSAGDALRQKVNTVGQSGQPGARVQNVISVAMLSEGWDARTVTHIMGLRAFTSQLLCEQVIGRGLRRASYDLGEDGLLAAEYVNVFGVPFSFLPHADNPAAPSPEPPKTIIAPLPDRAQYEIRWPNVLRIEHTFRAMFDLAWEKIAPLELVADAAPQLVQVAPMVDGRPNIEKITDMDLAKLMQTYRLQTMFFQVARRVLAEMKPNWSASPAARLAALVRLAEQFIASSRLTVTPPLFGGDAKRRRLVIALNSGRALNHFWHAIRISNAETTALVLDRDRPVCATGDMRPWRTRKPCHPTQKSHINYCVLDSALESAAEFHLDNSNLVAAWVKNEHLGFHIPYAHAGAVRAYWPDFLARLTDGGMLVLEMKGQMRDADKTKHDAMRQWVSAVNADGNHGRWQFAICRTAAEVPQALQQSGATRD